MVATILAAALTLLVLFVMAANADAYLPEDGPQALGVATATPTPIPSPDVWLVLPPFPTPTPATTPPSFRGDPGEPMPPRSR